MKTNSLTFRADKVSKKGTQYRISIRLNDECKNGHQDFAITGDMWEAGKPKSERYLIGGGAIGDKIAAAFPEFKIFNDLHLCDYLGNPMYSTANGLYHLQDKETAMSHLRITENEWEVLKNAGDQNHLGYMLKRMGIVERWKAEADQAIKMLEELTGDEFVVDSERNQFGMTEEQVRETEKLVSDGYYDPKAVAQRKDDAFKALKAKKIKAIEDDFATTKAKMEKEAAIKITILNMDILKDNFIYYSHSDTLTFNRWSWSDKFTQEEIVAIAVKLNNLRLFSGIIEVE